MSHTFFRAEHVWFDSPSSRETVEENRKPEFHKSLNQRLWANFKNLDRGQGTKTNAANEPDIEKLKLETTTNHQRGREGGKDRRLRQVEKEEKHEEIKKKRLTAKQRPEQLFHKTVKKKDKG